MELTELKKCLDVENNPSIKFKWKILKFIATNPSITQDLIDIHNYIEDIKFLPDGRIDLILKYNQSILYNHNNVNIIKQAYTNEYIIKTIMLINQDLKLRWDNCIGIVVYKLSQLNTKRVYELFSKLLDICSGSSKFKCYVPFDIHPCYEFSVVTYYQTGNFSFNFEKDSLEELELFYKYFADIKFRESLKQKIF